MAVLAALSLTQEPALLRGGKALGLLVAVWWNIALLGLSMPARMSFRYLHRIVGVIFDRVRGEVEVLHDRLYRAQ